MVGPMRRVPIRRALGFLLVAGTLQIAAIGATPKTSSGVDAPSSTDQVAAGGLAYRQACAACHGADLEGGNAPALATPDILNGYHTVGGLYAFIAVSMPPQSPGTLKKKDYAAIVAYILSRNGACTGGRALDPDAPADKDLNLTALAAGCPAAAKSNAGAPAPVAKRPVPQAYTWGRALPSVTDPK